jgi:hypothetical protein
MPVAAVDFFRPAANKQTSIAFNSFIEKLSQASQASAGTVAAQRSVPAAHLPYAYGNGLGSSQEIDAPRRFLVAPPASAPAPSNSSAAKVAPLLATMTLPASSMLPPNSNASSPLSTPSTPTSQDATTPPTADSVQDLSIAALLSYYAPPAPVAPTVQASTDPNVFMSDPNYMKGLSKQFIEMNNIDAVNMRSFQDYQFRLQTWVNGGKQGPLPDPPQYVQIDNGKFDSWWQLNCQMQIEGAQDPPQGNFIVPVAALAPPVITPPAAPPPATGSPVGAANGANNYQCSAADSLDRFPDGSTYTDSTGTYTKHVYITPFGTTVTWNKTA